MKTNKEAIFHLKKRVAATDAKVIHLISKIEKIEKALLLLTEYLQREEDEGQRNN
jgi:hypothetical protein